MSVTVPWGRGGGRAEGGGECVGDEVKVRGRGGVGGSEIGVRSWRLRVGSVLI
jgi:hypothetical protein